MHGFGFGIVAKHTHVIEFEWFVSDIAGIGEIDPASGMNDQVIRGIEFFAFKLIDNRFHFPVLRDLCQALFTVIGTTGGEQLAFFVDHQTVTLTAVGTEDGRLSRSGIKGHDFAFSAGKVDVAEINDAVHADAGTFGETFIDPELLQFCLWRDNGSISAWCGSFSVNQGDCESGTGESPD